MAPGISVNWVCQNQEPGPIKEAKACPGPGYKAPQTPISITAMNESRVSDYSTGTAFD